MESYLFGVPKPWRVALTRLCIGVHNLQVNLGRHHNPVIPLNNTICLYCFNQEGRRIVVPSCYSLPIVFQFKALIVLKIGVRWKILECQERGRSQRPLIYTRKRRGPNQEKGEDLIWTLGEHQK